MTNDQSQILVSICCITYNHAPFIRKALDGFLMQEPPTGVSKDEPWFEILIHDDASTDGTTEIIKEYEAKYSDTIFPLYEDENKYSHGYKGKIDLFNYNRVKGKYIAYCEGDDFWTDSHKLQKQVDFMEAHPDYSICFHACLFYDERLKEYSKDEKYWEDKFSAAPGVGFDVTSDAFVHEDFDAVPLSMVIRVSNYNFDWFNVYKGYRDTHEIYLLLRQGKGFFMNFIGGTHVLHNGGVYSSLNGMEASSEAREYVLDLYIHNTDDSFLREYLVSILLWNYYVYKGSGKSNSFWKILYPLMRQVPRVALKVLYVVAKRNVKMIFVK